MVDRSDTENDSRELTSQKDSDEPVLPGKTSGNQPDESNQSKPARLNYLASLVKRTCQGLALLSIPLFLFSLLGRYFYFAELLGNFRGYLLITLMIATTIFLLSKRWVLATITAPLLCWSMIGVVSVFLPGSQPPPGSEKLRIMSFNVLGSNNQRQLAVDQVQIADPDVVSILEYSGNWHAPLDCLNERYPHQIRVPRWHGFGIAMFSKYPFSDTEIIQLTKNKTDDPMIVTHVNYGSSPLPSRVRLAAVHVLSPTNQFRMKLRNQQFTEIADYLQQKNVPTIVMGDFNCVPWSPFLSDFQTSTKYRDSRQGFGYQATWHTKAWPVQIPIDHAFVSEHIHVHDRHVGGFGGSDHLPIVFEVSVED